MAVFDIAYKITGGNEAGYVNDKDDRGGETYNGISRVFFPNWSGWNFIDEQKKKVMFPENLVLVKDILDKKEAEFYKINFWDKIKGDLISSQFIANEMYDTCVNMGIVPTVKFLQRTLNILNRKGKAYQDIMVDGKFGPVTLKCLELSINKNGDALVYKILNVLQGYKYITLMESNENYEKYIGWFNRVDFIKK